MSASLHISTEILFIMMNVVSFIAGVAVGLSVEVLRRLRRTKKETR